LRNRQPCVVALPDQATVLWRGHHGSLPAAVPPERYALVAGSRGQTEFLVN
jgi:hypothetical protein